MPPKAPDPEKTPKTPDPEKADKSTTRRLSHVIVRDRIRVPTWANGTQLTATEDLTILFDMSAQVVVLMRTGYKTTVLIPLSNVLAMAISK